MYTHTLLSYFYVLFFKWIDMFMKIKWNKKKLLLYTYIYIYRLFFCSSHPPPPHHASSNKICICACLKSLHICGMLIGISPMTYVPCARKYTVHRTSHEHWAFNFFQLLCIMHEIMYTSLCMYHLEIVWI